MPACGEYDREISTVFEAVDIPPHPPFADALWTTPSELPTVRPLYCWYGRTGRERKLPTLNPARNCPVQGVHLSFLQCLFTKCFNLVYSLHALFNSGDYTTLFVEGR